MLSATTTVTAVAVVDEGASVCRSTVTEAVGEYLLLKDLSSRTVILYEGLFNRHARPAIGGTALADLKARDVDSVYAVMRLKGLSVTTIRQLHKILSAVLEQHVRWGLLSENVMGRATPPVSSSHNRAPPRIPPPPCHDNVPARRLVCFTHRMPFCAGSLRARA